MSDHKPYGLKTPCAKCPFRDDIRAYLTRARVRELQYSLERAEFPCHLTTTHDGEPFTTGKEMHCAGALILLEKLETPSQMMRICERIGLYDARTLNMDAPVFNSWEEMEEAQPR